MESNTLNNRVVSLFVLLLFFNVSISQNDSLVLVESKGTPVIIDGDTLFEIYSNLGPYSPDERAKATEARLEILLKEKNLEIDSIITAEVGDAYNIQYRGRILTTITQKDAEIYGKPIVEVADEYVQIIRSNIHTSSKLASIWGTLKEIGLTCLVILLIFLLIKYTSKLFRFFAHKLLGVKERFFKGIKFRNYEFLSAEREIEVVLWLMNVFKWLAVVVIIYAALPVLFSIFPATEWISETLFGYIWRPIKNLLIGLFNFLPNLFAIIVILFITHYLVKFLKFVSSEIKQEKLVIPGFYPDWSAPTFNIFRFLLYAFAMVAIFPYLPGSKSPVFQGVGVFIGLLVSFGSSSAISNMMAGFVITYMRAFKVGDRVKIGDTLGDVLEKTALVTRVRTLKNEIITIPNSSILTGHTINYSSSIKKFELILHTSVTIGYDVPWKQVHEMLIEATKRTDLLLNDPAPFVLQTGLDDFYVSYQLNAYTSHPKKSSSIYSQLHQNIQDIFNEQKVEILSPHYRAQRDGSAMTIPSSYLPEGYEPPPFHHKITKDDN